MTTTSVGEPRPIIPTLAPVAPTAVDDNDEHAERQVDGDDLADAVEAGAGARPVLDIDGSCTRRNASAAASKAICRSTSFFRMADAHSGKRSPIVGATTVAATIKAMARARSNAPTACLALPRTRITAVVEAGLNRRPAPRGLLRLEASPHYGAALEPGTGIEGSLSANHVRLEPWAAVFAFVERNEAARLTQVVEHVGGLCGIACAAGSEQVAVVVRAAPGPRYKVIDAHAAVPPRIKRSARVVTAIDALVVVASQDLEDFVDGYHGMRPSRRLIPLCSIVI